MAHSSATALTCDGSSPQLSAALWPCSSTLHTGRQLSASVVAELVGGLLEACMNHVHCLTWLATLTCGKVSRVLQSERKSAHNSAFQSFPSTYRLNSLQNVVAVMHGLEARLAEQLCGAVSRSPVIRMFVFDDDEVTAPQSASGLPAGPGGDGTACTDMNLDGHWHLDGVEGHAITLAAAVSSAAGCQVYPAA